MTPRIAMSKVIEFESDRLHFRQWRQADRRPFAALNADPRVMEFFPSPLTQAQSDALAERCGSLIQERGWGLWVAQTKADQQFIGFIGLHIPSPELPFSPCVEIGWRLAFPFWGKGLAQEGARAVLDVGFKHLKLPEIVAFTATLNHRSQALMKGLGMVASGAFEHPHVPEGNALRPHYLYRLSHDRYVAQQSTPGSS